MEKLLRSPEMDQIEQIFDQLFHYDNSVVYYPIRHHSPACSYHLKKVIDEYQPECVLIEGPSNANHLIQVMTDHETKAPFAIYYSYRDEAGYVSEDKTEYKCYYPFLDYSPELVALREGTKRKIPTEFIDLSYYEILIASKEGKGLRKEEEKNTYNDDYYLSKNAYIHQLCKETGLRNFEEFWEKYFEINGIQEETKEFVKHMFCYCYLSRIHSDSLELEEEGCLKREEYMSKKIKEASKKYSKTLVITGGFHSYGIWKLLHSEQPKTSFKSHTVEEKTQGVYVMPYSMEATDALNGYASGMPFPNFYQMIWNGILKGTEQMFEDAVLQMIVTTGKQLRKRKEALSSYDEICALSMAQGLAALRNKQHPGVYELLDCVLSSFIKGEYNFASEVPMQLLKTNLTGENIGTLCKKAEVPPIVHNFDQLCSSYGLKLHSTIEQEITLSIFTSPKHRNISSFFYQLEFLKTGYVKKIKGPDLKNKRGQNLVRELWSYKWSTEVITTLIDVSVNGGTLEEACTTLVMKKLIRAMNAREATRLLTNVYEMGLTELQLEILEQMEQILIQDPDFFSLVEALSYLIMLEEFSTLYQVSLPIQPCIHICYSKIMCSLPAMIQIKEEDLAIGMEACKTLYQLLQKDQFCKDQEFFYETLEQMRSNPDLQPGLEGCILGILYGAGNCTIKTIEVACTGFLYGSHEKQLQSAKFLRGLFYSARDLVFVESTMISLINQFIQNVNEKEFMEILPEFRIAFSYFTPSEIDEIAKRVATIYGLTKKRFFELEERSPVTYQYGKELDDFVVARLQEI